MPRICGMPEERRETYVHHYNGHRLSGREDIKEEATMFPEEQGHLLQRMYQWCEHEACKDVLATMYTSVYSCRRSQPIGYWHRHFQTYMAYVHRSYQPCLHL